MSSSSRLPAVLESIAVAAVCAVLLLATSPWLPLVWDEGDTIARAEQLDRSEWSFTTVREGHPPLAALLIAGGEQIAPSWLGRLTQARFGPILLFSLAAGAMWFRLQCDYHAWPVSLMAVGALLTMPRLFAHAHFATLDGPLTAAWVLAWASFAPAVRDWRFAGVFGLALGLTLTAKFTGWLAPLPFIAWTLLYRDRGGMRALLLGIPVALAVFVLLNPPLWEHPLTGFERFFQLNLERSARPEHNITTQFFGRLYNLDYPLPWYNSLVWTVITVTPILGLFALAGIVGSLRRWRSDRASILLVVSWATLVIVRALPWAPPHDAERLFLPSFAFLAALAGVGIGRGLYRDTLLCAQRIPAQGWAKVGMAIALGAAVVDSIGYFPHNLSYYSRLVGGLRGAAALGMEPTYYWDALDGEALAWLNEHTRDDEKVAWASAPPKNLELLKRWSMLERLPSDPGTFRWYVVQRRPSAWQPADQWLIAHARPAYQRTFSGVPLLDVYEYRDYERALAAAATKTP